jgi:toxin HigB-1
VIRSFRGKETEAMFLGNPTRRFRSIGRVVQRKLLQVHAARRLDDLRAFPGNRLESLSADRQGQHSIRVNDQFRVCFVWRDGDALDVEVTDYH